VDQDRERLAEQVAELAMDRAVTVGVAESLTGGMVASALAAATSASTWFRGSLVAYASEVKYEVLGVPRGPVVSAEAASEMARGARRLLGADVALGVTGAGGPDPQDGRDPGTVFLAVDCPEDHRVLRLELGGDPTAVCAGAADAAVAMLVEELKRLDGG
jgi:nicotinamide-nucleotide amidase